MHVPAIALRAVDRSRRFGSAALAIGWVAAAGAALADAASEPGPQVPGVASEVYVTGMTFVVSRPGQRDLVLEAPRATLHPETNKAELFEAIARAGEGPRGREFDVYCDRGELDLVSNDFLAEGNVHGSTADGQRYSAPWVRYEAARALLYTEAPVVLHDGAGTYRGDGFRYHLNEQRFELLGNVSVVHQP
jgi:LPS export ABC transporter protein LptC